MTPPRSNPSVDISGAALSPAKAKVVRIYSSQIPQSTNVGVKTDGSRVVGPDVYVKADGNRKQGTLMFTQVRALVMEVKPYVLLD